MSLRPKVIAVANGKGGVGKTTTAMALAGIFSEAYKVLAVDADSQGSFSWWTRRSDLGMDFDLAQETDLGFLGKLNEFKGYELVIVDTPPALGSEVLATVLAIADYLILPTPPSAMDLAVLIETVRKAIIPVGVAHRVLLTRVDPRSLGDALEAQKTLMESGIPVFRTFIRAYKAYERAALEGRQITQWRGNNAREAKADYFHVVNEIQSDWEK